MIAYMTSSSRLRSEQSSCGHGLARLGVLQALGGREPELNEVLGAELMTSCQVSPSRRTSSSAIAAADARSPT
jgi:hypothetical protein